MSTNVSMEYLPAELLQEIFLYACTDGGFTGRSLSCVSKHINAVSEHVRYQTVEVYGARHIESFSFRLTSSKLESGLRRIRHLLLSDRSLCSPRSLSASRSDGKDTSSQLITNITFILNAIAPHLETLLLIITTLRKPTPLSLSVLSFLSDLPFSPLIPADLPALRELTIASPLIPLSFQHSKRAPRLERLHIAVHTELPATIGQSLRKVVPDLTHLRVSSLRGRTDGGGLSDMLKAFVLASSTLAVPENRHLSSSLGQFFPRHLQRVIIAPRPATRSRGVSRVFGTLAQNLEQICRDDTQGKILVMKTIDCLKDDNDHEKVLYERRYRQLRTEWLERIEGEQGCWYEGSGYLTYWKEHRVSEDLPSMDAARIR